MNRIDFTPPMGSRGWCTAATIAACGFALTAVSAAFTPNEPNPPATAPTTQPATKPATEPLIIAGEQFDLEVAATPEARERGLMHRDRIAGGGGMLFIYPQPQVLSFWMKNCPIEMDILFVSDERVIVATHRMKPAPPRLPREPETDYDDRLPRYESRKPAQFAIELQAGTIEGLKIRPGDKIEMDVKRLAKLAAAGEH